MQRRKIDFAKIRAEKAAGLKNEDDGRPWFLTRQFAPPVHREVRAIWPDGLISFATRTNSGWDNDLWASRRLARREPPIGWKPWHGMGGCPSGIRPPEPLPDPLHYGLQVT
jgi:hypothetical protein